MTVPQAPLCEVYERREAQKTRGFRHFLLKRAGVRVLLVPLMCLSSGGRRFRPDIYLTGFGHYGVQCPCALHTLAACAVEVVPRRTCCCRHATLAAHTSTPLLVQGVTISTRCLCQATLVWLTATLGLAEEETTLACTTRCHTTLIRHTLALRHTQVESCVA